MLSKLASSLIYENREKKKKTFKGKERMDKKRNLVEKKKKNKTAKGKSGSVTSVLL